MVEELIKHHWCDKHGYEARVEGRGIAIEIDGRRWHVDLCEEDEAQEIEPLISFLEKFARPVGSKPVAPAVKPVSKPRYEALPGLDANRENADYPCPLCPKDVSTGSNFGTHLKMQHDTLPEKVYGTSCLDCNEERTSYGGFAKHAKTAHGTTVPKMFMAHISGVTRRALFESEA